MVKAEKSEKQRTSKKNVSGCAKMIIRQNSCAQKYGIMNTMLAKRLKAMTCLMSVIAL